MEFKLSKKTFLAFLNFTLQQFIINMKQQSILV